MMTLKDYLARRHRWEPGVCDCTLYCGEWVREATGKDPGAGIRGTYSTIEEARAIVAAHGGITAFIGARLEPLGFQRAHRPMDGDIGIVSGIYGIEGEGPGICYGPLWAVMSPRGQMVKALAFTGAAWRLA